MDYLELLPREESHVRYDINKEIYSRIEEAYKNSLKNLTPEDLAKVSKYVKPENLEFNIILSSTVAQISYSTSNLSKSGCALLCFEEGLKYKRRTPYCIDYISRVASANEYYEEGKGTYHNLFDHYGLRRCTSIYDVIDSINHDSLFTVLVVNSLYHKDPKREGHHFVNLLTIIDGKAIIDDPSVGRLEMDFIDFAKSSTKVWQW